MSVRICDVGPRDGLQNHPGSLPLERRAELCRRLATAGVRHVEAASFVRDDRVPKMAGAEAVLAALEEGPPPAPAIWSALVLNERGYLRAREMRLPEVHVAVMATETFSARNANTTVEEALAAATRIVSYARRDRVRVVATVGVAFGCPFEGRVEGDTVAAVAERLAEAGADELMLADTIGCAAPRQVGTLVERVCRIGLPVGAHLHNTRNTGYANALAALDRGASTLEASIGGIGGCPFAPSATGNVATEDLVNLLHGQGVDTGIDLEALIGVAQWLEQALGTPVPGYVHRAGPFPGHYERSEAR